VLTDEKILNAKRENFYERWVSKELEGKKEWCYFKILPQEMTGETKENHEGSY
jgi:hypothetical protein